MTERNDPRDAGHVDGSLRLLIESLGLWPGIAAMALQAAAGALWGLIRLSSTSSRWHSCVISTCEGNHIGSPALFALIVTGGAAFVLSVVCGALLVWDLTWAVARRALPPGQSVSALCICALAFTLQLAIWMWAGGRTPAEALTDFIRFTVVFALVMSVTSGLSFVALGWGAFQTVHTRTLRSLPAAAVLYGLVTISVFASWWAFSDRTV